eukprot:15345127-Ditylum_brightwellii.AAC.1
MAEHQDPQVLIKALRYWANAKVNAQNVDVQGVRVVSNVTGCLEELDCKMNLLAVRRGALLLAQMREVINEANGLKQCIQ